MLRSMNGLMILDYFLLQNAGLYTIWIVPSLNIHTNNEMLHIAQAVPRITTDFNSLNDAAWYSSGYFLTNMAMQLAFGQIYTSFSVKYTYVISVIIFEAGSIICALAPSSPHPLPSLSVAWLPESAAVACTSALVSIRLSSLCNPD